MRQVSRGGVAISDLRISFDQPDVRLIFEQVPGLYLILLPDRPRFTIAAVSDAYAGATNTKRDGASSILGRAMFEVFPDPPDDPQATGVRNLRASLERALLRRVPDLMPVQHYNIRRQDGSWEERHWSPRNVPMLGPDREVRYLLHEVVDVTKVMKAQAAEAAAREAVALAEQALTAARAELKQERALIYNLQRDTEELRTQGETLRAELHRLVEHSTSLRQYVKDQRLGRGEEKPGK